MSPAIAWATGADISGGAALATSPPRPVDWQAASVIAMSMAKVTRMMERRMFNLPA